MEEGRRRTMLAHQMSVMKRPPNYHQRDDDEDDDEENEEERHRTRTTPSSARSYRYVEKESSTATSRTLFDIIQAEESSAAFAYSGAFGRGSSNKLNWKSFKDRLRIRRTGTAWNSSCHSVPISDDFRGRPIPSPRALARKESRIGRVRIEEEDEEDDDRDDDNKHKNNGNNDEDDNDDDESEEEARGAGTVSLMSLLEQTANEEDEEQDDDDEEEEEEDGGGRECVCCVCMVRHKGSAFSPCGHNFCRLCSRELWVSKGNCPLCNGYIYEILNVF